MSGAAPGKQPNPGDGKGQKVQQLGKYRLLARIGQGGMGSVYKATDTQMNRTVALKVLSPHLVANRNYVERFLREARSAAALSHPNIVGALDVGQEGTYYYFAMEYVDGETLRQRLKRESVFSEEEALNIVLQVANALHHAAGKSIIHRDIKPENVMISKAGEVKLTDMGLAKATDKSEATITQAGHMIGTPQYASPEQIRGEVDIDNRTDIYSLGMTVYHMVAGHPPFDGPTAAVITSKHLEEPLPDIRQEQPELSEGFCRILNKMCQKAPDDRYERPEDLIDDLELVLGGELPKHAGRTLPTNLQRSRLRTRMETERQSGLGKGALAAMAGAVILGGGAVYMYLGQNGGGPVGPTTVPKISTTAPRRPVLDPDLPNIQEGPKQDAKAALLEAQKFALSHPDDLSTIFTLFSEVLKFSGTPQAQAAQEKLREVSQEVDAAFGGKEKLVLGLIARGSYRDALVSLSMFPDRYQFGEWDQRFVNLKDRSAAAIESTFEALERKAGKLIEDKSFAQALVLYEGALECFPVDYVEDIEETIEEVKVKGEEYKDELVVLKLQLCKKFLDLNRRRFKDRDYAEVARRAEAAQEDPDYAAVVEEMKVEEAHAKLLIRLLELAEAGAKKRVGKTFRLHKRSMRIAAVADGALKLTVPGGIELAQPITRMESSAILDLASSEFHAVLEKNVMLGALYFAEGFAEGDLKQAREQWEAAAEDGYDVAIPLKKIEMLERGEKEFQAQAVIARIRAKFRRREYADVVKMVEEARTVFEDTEAMKTSQADLFELLAQAKDSVARGTVASTGGTKRPSSTRRRMGSDGLEANRDWRPLRWPTGSGSGSTSFGGLKGADDPNQVFRFQFHGVAGKIFVGREAGHDFSKAGRLLVRIHNPSKADVMISLALCTGPRFEYHESPIDLTVRGNSSGYNRFSLKASNFKCAASGWAFRSRVADLDDVRRLVFVVHTNRPDGELIFEHIEATR